MTTETETVTDIDALTGVPLAVEVAKALGWKVAPHPRHPDLAIMKNPTNHTKGTVPILPRPDRDITAAHDLLEEATRRGWEWSVESRESTWCIIGLSLDPFDDSSFDATVPGTDRASFCTAVCRAFLKAQGFRPTCYRKRRASV